ncbi:MAG TPA: non-homologous end-joining DNA ligase, partial [Rubrivivax sp.]|nr:non-homologous end-joining DNA ligase [Rubrivivax sp.]
ARIDQRGTARLFTRAGNDWTAKMPRLADELSRLQLPPAWIDGEVVVLDDAGVPDFNALQNAFDTAKAQRLTYFAFDLPYFDGRDLRQEPLTTRRALLRQALRDKASDSEQVRFSEDFAAEAGSVLQAACRMNLEGVIAKRADAPYRNDRSTTWLKLKCQQRQEFVIAGFTERSDAPGQIGSLLLGLHDERGVLRSVGAVGTGWNFEVARRLFDQLSALQQPAQPFDAEPEATGGVVSGAVRGKDGGSGGKKDSSQEKATRAHLPKRPARRAPPGARWVQPSLMAEVAFGGFTPDGQIRHASFVAQRSDKEPRMITLEKPIKPSAGATPAKDGASRVGGINISNAKRVIDPQSGTTTIDLVRYYESVASYMLPHLKGRAVALVRGPAGIGGQLFFQKHDDKRAPDAPVEVATLKALLQGAQLNVIEFHTGNSRPAGARKPDRVVFDLDPGEGVGWAQIQEAAQLVRAMLQELELQTWLKTSGGKGLHLVLPIVARWDADVVKDFSRAVVEHLARTLPDRFVAKSGGGNRVGRIFVDYLRNGSEATTVAAFSARARPGMGVSMPLAWDDLRGLKSGAHFTVANARDHVSFQTQDPWVSYWQTRQSLSGAMKLLGLRKTSA